jgi:hypothetical protein
MVINLLVLVDNLILTNPSITDSPAIAPTADDENPEDPDEDPDDENPDDPDDENPDDDPDDEESEYEEPEDEELPPFPYPYPPL